MLCREAVCCWFTCGLCEMPSFGSCGRIPGGDKHKVMCVKVCPEKYGLFRWLSESLPYTKPFVLKMHEASVFGLKVDGMICHSEDFALASKWCFSNYIDFKAIFLYLFSLRLIVEGQGEVQ